MPVPFLNPKDSFITCRDREDGGGAQISARISAMIIGRLKGMKYAHSPLANVTHAPPDLDTASWSAAWEDFFNLGLGEFSAAEVEAGGARAVKLTKPHRFLPRSNRLYFVGNGHRLTDKHPEAWAQIAPDIRRKYFASPKPDLPGRDPGLKHVAVHLRRGDVDVSGIYSERFTPTENVIAPLTRTLDELGRENCRLHLFSQGQPEDFASFLDLGAELHLDEDPFVSFHHMVQADVLYTAKSTFSYLAGVIGTGRVVYEPFWHPALPGWETLG